MAKNLQINPELLEEAFSLSGLETKSQAVNLALEKFVRRKKQLQFISILGTIDFDPEYDNKKYRD